MNRDIDTVLRHYLIAAIWSSGNDGEFDDLTPDEVDAESATTARGEIVDFLAVCKTNKVNLTAWTDEQLGHDFWLTRCGHGAGFWDRGQGKDGKDAADWARVAGSRDIYLGDDGVLYIS